MTTILKLVQGTPEWHAHRAQSRNASETAVVLGVSPWQTPYGLWCLRTGRTKQEVTRPMLRGAELEGAARAAYEAKTGLVMEPLVLQDEGYSASLDGITLAGDLILEIKCPFKGQASELWHAVAIGELPEHYWWQVQHQLMVSKAARAEVFVFDGAEGIVREVVPKPDAWPRIHAAWQKFDLSLASDTPPPLCERDVRVRDDAQWAAVAAQYIEAKAAAERSGAALEAVKAQLVALAEHPRELGGGVTVTRYWKAGSVDYKKIPELGVIDVEKYRGRAREEVRVTVAA
jgi:putative phage-type endonuclease